MHQICHAHCPKPAAAGGAGLVVAFVVGYVVLSDPGVQTGVNALIHTVMMVCLWIVIAAVAAAAGYAAYRVIRWRRRVQRVAKPAERGPIRAPRALPARSPAAIEAPRVIPGDTIPDGQQDPAVFARLLARLDGIEASLADLRNGQR